MPRYLTKSLFKIGLTCPTGLYYQGKPDLYVDETIQDPFLQGLAQGGFQVGELAKFLFSEDPVAEQITITERNYERAIRQTNERLFNGDSGLVAEGTVRFEDLLIRADILHRQDQTINLYEVKAKSWRTGKDFWSGNRQGEIYLHNDWIPYLYDVAFQKFVISKAFPSYNIKAHLILVDADVAITIDGMNQLFKIEKNGERTRVRVAEGVTAKNLGVIPLRILPVDNECDWIFRNAASIDLTGEISFEGLIKLFSEAFQKDERIWSPIGRKCRDCQFQTVDASLAKNGFVDCWRHWANFTDEDFAKPLVLELWGGKGGFTSFVNEAVHNRKYFLSSLEEADYYPRNFTPAEAGLRAAERRKKQIEMRINDNDSFYLDRDGLKKVFDELPAPYHFIDFETTMVALPFHRNRKPYEAIAFQYSYHVMDEKGHVQHKNQFLSFDPGFPNFDFVRSLKKDLQDQPGTIFRYHNHENNYLKFIYKQLMRENVIPVPDRNELVNFIQHISHCKKDKDIDCPEWEGEQDMVDLYELVLSYYYSPKARGWNGLKYILPAAINDSRSLREKYSQPVYGTAACKSLNFQNHTWISKETDNNPYQTLPQVLEGYDNDDLDQFFPGMDDVREGGAAMMAYAYLQFSNVPKKQKQLIRNALLRYCELDTMAMVMIWEFWGNEIGRFG